MVAAHPNVEFIGEINELQKADFLGNARALLFPICWPEPFGLVMIEAMACGTPVVALAHGSVPEIIDHGLSGFVVNCVDEAVAAANAVETLDRAAIRKRFEQRFTAARMARDYLAAYRRLPALRQMPQLDARAALESNSGIRMPIPSACLEIAAAAAG
jgi:glycosyltransferase involved in cell wall biosynthesis